MSTMRSHSSIGAPSIGPLSITPALLTTVSSRPSSALTRSTAANACKRSVMSAATTRARPASSAASCSKRSARRATSATVAPRAASALAVASPIPLLAPVTSATVPSSRSAMSAHVPEEGPDLVDEQLGLLEGREVPAAVQLVVVAQVTEPALDPAPRGGEDLAREDRDARRQLHRPDVVVAE